ncbi:MAG: Calx-beta domain-containing protein, partial [Planctomycetota bacterium]
MCRQYSILCVAVLLLCLAGFAQAADVILQCDAGEGLLQAGWTQVLKGTNVNVAGSGINVTLATGAPAAITARDTGGSGALADVETDLYFADNQTESPGSDFILTLSNLTPGMPYRLLSYHNRSDEGDTTIPGVTVTGATVIIAPSTILQTHAIMDDPAEFIFVADTATVSIRYQAPDGGCAGCQAFFNGFQLEYGPPAISFAAESSGAVETISPAMIAVNLNNAEPAQTYTVDYRVIGGTADGGGVDYYLAEPNTFTFSPGQTSKYIVIDINSDGVQEPDETIVLELSNVTGPNCVLGISEHTYTISDGPPRVSFLQAGDSGSENVPSATIPVVLSHASDQTVTVDYEVTGGTATSGGVDYDLFEPNTMTFNPGQTSKIVSIDIIEDDEKEDDETINLTLSNAHNAILSSPTTHTYTIIDNEEGVRWNGTTWYYSAVPNNNLFVNPEGQLEWQPEREQYITRITDHDLSDVGDLVEIEYWWMSDGDHDCPDCLSCDLYCFDDDITCVAGTSDIRVGLFEADGEYVEADGLGVSNSIFNGYKGYQFRFGPNMMAGPTRWRETCTEEPETHKTGQIQKKDVSFSDLLSSNDHPKLIDLPGFELPPGEWTLFTMRLERQSSSSVDVSMTFNDRTYSAVDGSSSGQPQIIDVLGIYMRNGRPYTRLVLDNVCEAVGDADFDGDDVVDENDLKVIADDWLLTGGFGPMPDANYLVLHYNFDETSGSTAYDSSSPAYNGAVQVVSSGAPKTNAWNTGGQDAGCINFDGNTKV